MDGGQPEREKGKEEERLKESLRELGRGEKKLGKAGKRGRKGEKIGGEETVPREKRKGGRETVGRLIEGRGRGGIRVK